MDVDMSSDDGIDAKIEQMKLQFAEGVKFLIYNWGTLTSAIDQGFSEENIEVYGEIKKLINGSDIEEQTEDKATLEKFLRGTLYPNDESAHEDNSVPDRAGMCHFSIIVY